MKVTLRKTNILKKETKKQDLATFLKNNCDYVNIDEQKEFEKIKENLKKDSSESREISMDELLGL